MTFSLALEIFLFSENVPYFSFPLVDANIGSTFVLPGSRSTIPFSFLVPKFPMTSSFTIFHSTEFCSSSYTTSQVPSDSKPPKSMAALVERVVAGSRCLDPWIGCSGWPGGEAALG